MTILRFALQIFLALLSTALAVAQSAGCDGNNPLPSVTISLPDHPFAVALSRDGCHVFVSLGASSGIAVLKRERGSLSLARTVKIKARAAFGMALTRDGQTLVVAGFDRVVFLDVRRMISGVGTATLGSFSDGAAAGSIVPNISPDEKLLFVSDERRRSITVVDFERARGGGFKRAAATGTVPTGSSPIALVFSPDGRWLYTSAQIAPPAWNWPKTCKREMGDSSKIVNPEGAVVVLDVTLARTDPAGSIAARIPAGCSPVRLALSPDGGLLYATARNQNALLAFDTEKFLTDPRHARIGSAAVGASPVPVAVVGGGKRIVVVTRTDSVAPEKRANSPSWTQP